MSTGIIGLYIFIYYYRYSYVPWTTKFANPILRIFLVFSPLLFIMVPYAAAGGAALIMSGDMTYFEFLNEQYIYFFETVENMYILIKDLIDPY